MEYSEAKLGARLVLLALAEYAYEDGTNACPGVGTIAKKARLSRRAVQEALRKLEDAGMIAATGTSQYATTTYSILGVPPTEGGAESARGGALSAQGGAKITTQNTSSSSPDPTTNPVEEHPLVRIREAWLAEDALISHRETYFDATCRRQVEKAVAKYGVDDVVAAIRSYAAVLASPRHYFSYEWPLVEFLRRGLDRFVPESSPERNFARDKSSTPAGAAAFDRLPDL